MSRKVLVAYASKMGATAEIAETIGEVLRADGHDVQVMTAADVLTTAPYDAVVLGSAIYVRRWRPAAVRLLRRHRDDLRHRQIWLFHSGPVGPEQDEDPTIPTSIAMPANVRRLARSIGATPAVTFAGRLETATATGFLARRLARSTLAGDYRDWPKIRAWAGDVSAAIAASQSIDWNGIPRAAPPAGNYLG